MDRSLSLALKLTTQVHGLTSDSVHSFTRLQSAATRSMDFGSERSKLEARVAISSSCDLGNVPKLAKPIYSTLKWVIGTLK